VFAVVIAISAAFLIAAAGNTRMETDLDEYMPKDHPAFVYSDEAEEWFDIKDGIIIAIEHPDGIYNHGTLSKVKDLTKELQKHDRIDRGDVTSLYTADNITGSEDGLDVRAFFSKVPESLIIAQIGDEAFSQEFYREILDLTAAYEGPEKLYVAGRPIVEGTMAYLAPKDMKRMVPIVLLVIIAVLLLVLRSPKSTLFTMLVVVLSTLWTFGLMAWLGIPIYAVSTMIPVMLIAIGVADGIHIYGHLGLYQRKHPGVGARDGASEMIRGMWKPVIMTSVTTAVGFVSLLTSDVYPIKYFGLFTAFGVMVAMILSLVLIPAGVVAFGLPRARKARPKQDGTDDIALRFGKGLMRHRRLVVAAAIIVVVVSAMGATKIWINSSFLEKFERDSDIVLTDAFINERFGGTSTLNVILESADEGDADGERDAG
jgi:predicted RND superfamily exporter protein